ncbi:MAG TPA: HDIG domain-containing protein, partial [Lacipirellula sp.]
MSIANPKRTRQQRVASVELPPGAWRALWNNLQRGAVVLRLAICALAALFLWAFTRTWDPPFSHRVGEIPSRNLVARVDFEQPDPAATLKARDEARSLAIAEYDQDPEPLIQLRSQLVSEVNKLLTAKSLEDVDQNLWQQFQPTRAPGTPDPTAEEQAENFARFRAEFDGDKLNAFEQNLAEAMAEFEDSGFLVDLPPEHDANAEKIFVRRKGSENWGREYDISEVRINQVAPKVQAKLNEELSSLQLAAHVYAWMGPRLPTTLKLNQEATHTAQEKAAAAVQEVVKKFAQGKDVLALAGEPLDDDSLKLLRLEHEAEIENRTTIERLQRSIAMLGMFVALYTLSGFYLHMRDRRVIDELLRLIALLALFVLTVGVAKVVSGYAWGADVIPLLLFGMIVAIAYSQEMALLLSACVALVIVVTIGHGFTQSLALMATVAGAVLVLKQVRTRSRLLLVGFTAAGVGFLTTIGVGILDGRAWTPLLQEGFTIALWSVIAGSLMTVLLPTVEKVFGVETDLSLIELGDPAHPLLQELIRRAPGTYNHSITVASLAEAAAESIGARGLLVRVGAYFHDIGKMLKPGYF